MSLFILLEEENDDIPSDFRVALKEAIEPLGFKLRATMNREQASAFLQVTERIMQGAGVMTDHTLYTIRIQTAGHRREQHEIAFLGMPTKDELIAELKREAEECERQSEESGDDGDECASEQSSDEAATLLTLAEVVQHAPHLPQNEGCLPITIAGTTIGNIKRDERKVRG